ncbi:von Willebrand factor A domain-containing protein 7-like isoform X2 [Tachysurus fulvidraco]|uniref:von Willebrand factor A domain-containing protein 7-like isoform X2 n=1 Tax=Tachysurus fulvidraco TaxID=1234273 RepID=UPI001FF05B41|nr:von Willebrand factor A domain-containing protein 7-like isoform X2 [Tachysurus fulvidraco]
MSTTNMQIKSLIYIHFMLILMTSQTLTFKILWTKSKTHQDITRDAVLQTIVDICRLRMLQMGQNFVEPGVLTVNSVAESCYSSDSAKDFQESIDKINKHNVWIDYKHIFTGSYHFDNEEFLSGRNLITEGVSVVKSSVKQKSYQAAKRALGKVLHTLQDFYSHSNWIELGKTGPYSNLIKPDTPINNIADSKTCRKCTRKDCKDNILEEIIAQQKLTSGYFGFYRPTGKCSHGGILDPSSWWYGGINKDSSDSSHGHLHETAAFVATAATRELLQNIRAAVGDTEFLRLMGFSQTSVLSFVVDTTSNMSEDIEEVRRVTSFIIDSKTDTEAQRSEYILVPFNDPDYGPNFRTTDPGLFKKKLTALMAEGGRDVPGDVPEMCLSGLQLALTTSPPQTEIFVFTDADAKDEMLKNTILALIERTKSVVNFMLTKAISSQQVSSHVYHDLAQASGGHVIEVTKGALPQASKIIPVTSRATLVNIFQAVRNPGKVEKFSAFVDDSVQNLTIFITGNSLDYTISSPSGVSQSSTELNGALGLFQKAGNFHIVQPNIAERTGWWVFDFKSTQPYSIRVVDTNITLLVTMVGGESVRPTELSLVEALNSNSINGSLEEVASGQYLVTFNSIPAGEFTVRLVGQISSSRSSNINLQRQSPTRFQTSTVTITTPPVGTMEPGKQFTLPYLVATQGSGGTFKMNVNSDHNFETFYNTFIALENGGSANGTVNLTVPENTPSGTDVTVTIEAEAPDGSDFNYAVLHLSVIAPITDITPPVCKAVTINSECSGNCKLSSWYLTANMTDGSGIQTVRVLQGNGTTVLSETGMNITMVNYSSSCCFQELEMVAVDTVGNVATCFKSLRATAAPSLLTYGGDFFLILPICLCMNIVTLLFQFMQL